MGFIFGIGYDETYSIFGAYRSIYPEQCDECEEPARDVVGLRLGHFYVFIGVESH